MLKSALTILHAAKREFLSIRKAIPGKTGKSLAIRAISTIKGLRHIGNALHKVGALSFVIDGYQPEDISRYLDGEGIAVRAGHHCAQPAMARFNVAGTVRPSLAFYNTHEEIDLMVHALKRMLNRGWNPVAFDLQQGN